MAAISRTDLSIFICYRRADTSGEAVALSDKLNRRRGFEVFKDVDSIRPGQDWLETVEESIEQCDVLLALIGPDWISSREDEGHGLDENDHVRREIEAALARKKAIIPILFEQASMPRSEQLPDSLRPLLRRQSMRIRNSTFNRDLEVLVIQLRTIARLKSPTAQPVGEAVTPRTIDVPRPTPSPVVRPTTPRPPPPPAPTRQATPTREHQSEAQPVSEAQPTGPGPASASAAPSYQGQPQPPAVYSQPTPPMAPGWLGPLVSASPQSRNATWMALAAGAALAISGALFAIVGLLVAIEPESFLGGEFSTPGVGLIAGMMLGAIGAFELIAAIGVFRRQRWARIGGCIAAAIPGVIYLLALDPLSLAIALVHGLIIVGLLAGKSYFEQGSSRTPNWR